MKYLLLLFPILSFAYGPCENFHSFACQKFVFENQNPNFQIQTFSPRPVQLLKTWKPVLWVNSPGTDYLEAPDGFNPNGISNGTTHFGNWTINSQGYAGFFQVIAKNQFFNLNFNNPIISIYTSEAKFRSRSLYGNEHIEYRCRLFDRAKISHLLCRVMIHFQNDRPSTAGYLGFVPYIH